MFCLLKTTLSHNVLKLLPRTRGRAFFVFWCVLFFSPQLSMASFSSTCKVFFPWWKEVLPLARVQLLPKIATGKNYNLCRSCERKARYLLVERIFYLYVAGAFHPKNISFCFQGFKKRLIEFLIKQKIKSSWYKRKTSKLFKKLYQWYYQKQIKNPRSGLSRFLNSLRDDFLNNFSTALLTQSFWILHKMVQEHKDALPVLTQLIKFYDQTFGKKIMLFRLTGHFRKTTIAPFRAGVQGERKSIYVDLPRIGFEEYFFIFLHEITHFLDTELKQAIVQLGNAGFRNEVQWILEKQKHGVRLRSSEQDKIDQFLLIGFNRGLFTEYRAWLIGAFLYQEGKGKSIFLRRTDLVQRGVLQEKKQVLFSSSQWKTFFGLGENQPLKITLWNQISWFERKLKRFPQKNFFKKMYLLVDAHAQDPVHEKAFKQYPFLLKRIHVLRRQYRSFQKTPPLGVFQKWVGSFQK